MEKVASHGAQALGSALGQLHEVVDVHVGVGHWSRGRAVRWRSLFIGVPRFLTRADSAQRWWLRSGQSVVGMSGGSCWFPRRSSWLGHLRAWGRFPEGIRPMFFVGDGGRCFKSMRGGHVGAFHCASVGLVGNCFGHGAEGGWRLDPPHGASHRNGD